MITILLVWIAWTAKGTPSIFELKAQLSQAQKDVVLLQEKIVHLEEEIARKEMAFIRIQLEKAYGQLTKQQIAPRKKQLAYLVGQREVLHAIMESVPACHDEAEQLHEALLNFITDLDNAQILDQLQKNI